MLFRLGPANEGMLCSNDYVHSTYLSAVRSGVCTVYNKLLLSLF